MRNANQTYDIWGSENGDCNAHWHHAVYESFGGTLCLHLQGRQYRQSTCNVTVRRVRVTIVAGEKRKILHICLCVCQRARACLPAWAWVPGCVAVCMRERAYSLAYPACIAMRHIVTSFVVPLSLPYFSTVSRKQNDFRKKVTEHKMYVLIFSPEFVWNISRSKNKSAKYCHKCGNVFT